MHRDVVTHVAVSAAEFFITGSVDGKYIPSGISIVIFFIFLRKNFQIPWKEKLVVNHEIFLLCVCVDKELYATNSIIVLINPIKFGI